MTRVRAAASAAVLALAAMAEGGPAVEHTNRLARESSPYLLQHQHNPVDWYPWGDEAFAAAARDGKPIFLSIGYSTCHWCHVMERESFENEEIAALLNRDFVSIKVDREERPDIDNVYMTACQLLTRSGGWPLTAILTPSGLPFFAGTYFPPDDRYGRAGMRTLLPRLAAYWKDHRTEAEAQAKEVAAAVRRAVSAAPTGNAAPLDAAFFRSIGDDLARRFDEVHGGFSNAPKFPSHGALAYLLAVDSSASARSNEAGEPEKNADRRAARTGGEPAKGNAGEAARNAAGEAARNAAMLRKTLDAMQDGGIFDHVGGGFHRYSVDEAWFIPHFEKMLYDNAQLLGTYASAARRFGDARYRETALRIVDWLERDMRTPEGAYASALDADSEGVEGKYYLWTAAEIEATLGPEAPLYRRAFDIEPHGNTPSSFEEGRGKNLPRRVHEKGEGADVDRRLAADQDELLAVRARRTPPARDDKVLTSWNALAISALARASADLGEPRLLAIAERVAKFLLAVHVSGDRVWHGSRGGVAKIDGFLDDDAFLAAALLDLAEASRNPVYRETARRIAAGMVRRFADPAGGGFFQTAAPASGERGFLDLAKEFLDQVVPSPNGVAIDVLRRLDRESPDAAFRAAADRALASGAAFARAFPTAATTLAAAALEGPATMAPASAAASPSQAVRGPVRVAAAANRTADGIALEVSFSLDPGWHVQSRRPSRGDLSPTEVAFAGNGWREPASRYPSAELLRSAGEELSVYTGNFGIGAVRRPVPAEPGAITAEISFQACNDSRCLAPERVTLTVPFSEEKP